MILSFIDKVTTGTYSLALFIWNLVPVGLALWFSAIAAVIYISDILHSLDHEKSGFA